MDYGAMISRVIRAASLDTKFYNQVKNDKSLTQEALIVVAIVALLAGIGGLGSGIGGLLFGVVFGIIGYYVGGYAVYLVGNNLFSGKATDVGQVLRPLGYTQGPRVLSLLGFLPFVGWLLAFVGGIWTLVATFLAIRESMEMDNTKALLTLIVAGIAVAIISLILGLVFGVSAMGMMG